MTRATALMLRLSQRDHPGKPERLPDPSERQSRRTDCSQTFRAFRQKQASGIRIKMESGDRISQSAGV